MKHFSLFRLLPCILIAVPPALLSHCGGAADATDTGNPGITEQKLHILLGDTGVEVVGDAGAVDAGANVSVTNRSSGEHAQAIAKVDGSFLVVVRGSLQDEYEVTVSSGSSTQTLGISASSNEIGDTGTDLTSASCASLDDTLDKLITNELAAGDKTCESDVDCVYADRHAACASQCGATILSAAGLQVATTAFGTDVTPACNEFSRRCGTEPPASCPPPPDPFEAECYGRACRSANIDGLTCNDLLNKAASYATDLVDRAPRACTSSADCALVSEAVHCVQNCGTPYQSVNVNAVDAAKVSVQRVEDYFCSHFSNRPCPRPLTLPCAAETGPLIGPQASCIAGQCQVVAAPAQ